MSPLRHHWGEAQIALTFLKIDLAIGLENTGGKKNTHLLRVIPLLTIHLRK